MTPKQAIEFFQGASRLGRALGVTAASVSEWVSAGEIPEGRQYQIQIATGGRLLADRPALRMEPWEIQRIGLDLTPLPTAAAETTPAAG